MPEVRIVASYTRDYLPLFRIPDTYIRGRGRLTVHGLVCVGQRGWQSPGAHHTTTRVQPAHLRSGDPRCSLRGPGCALAI